LSDLAFEDLTEDSCELPYALVEKGEKLVSLEVKIHLEILH
jgi:hypothetical protein